MKYAPIDDRQFLIDLDALLRVETDTLRKVLKSVVFGFDHEMIGKGREYLQNAIIIARDYIKESKDE